MTSLLAASSSSSLEADQWLPAASLLAQEPWMVQHSTEVISCAIACGAVGGLAILVLDPETALRFSLGLLTPLIQKQKTLSKVVAGGHYMSLKLPPLNKLKEACYLLQTTLKEDVFLCGGGNSLTATAGTSCKLSGDLSECAAIFSQASLPFLGSLLGPPTPTCATLRLLALRHRITSSPNVKGFTASRSTCAPGRWREPRRVPRRS